MTPEERLLETADSITKSVARMERMALPRSMMSAWVTMFAIAAVSGAYGYADLSARLDGLERDRSGTVRFIEEQNQLRETRDKAMSIRLEAIAAKLGVRLVMEKR